MSKLIQRLLNDENGATAIEYCLLCGWDFARDHSFGKLNRPETEHDIHQRFQSTEVAR